MWREPWAAPLYATGSEFAWHEKAWEQGTATASVSLAGYADVPSFLLAVRAVLASPAYNETADEAAKIDLLFGMVSPLPPPVYLTLGG